MDIKLFSKNFIVKEIKKPTKATFFREVEVGDVLIFTTYLKSVGRNRGLYASSYECYNLSKHKGVRLSQNNLCNRLENFEIEEKKS